MRYIKSCVIMPVKQDRLVPVKVAGCIFVSCSVIIPARAKAVEEHPLGGKNDSSVILSTSDISQQIRCNFGVNRTAKVLDTSALCPIAGVNLPAVSDTKPPA